MVKENAKAETPATVSEREVYNAYVISTIGLSPSSTVTQSGPGTRKGRASRGSRFRSTTSARNSKTSDSPHSTRSTVMSRSNVNPNASAQHTPHAKIATHGEPLRNRLVNTAGRKPSSASACGSRVYDMVRLLNVPKSSMTPATTTAVANIGPPSIRAASTQAPVEKREAGMPAHATAEIGIA